MNGPSNDRINPIEDQDLFLKMIRRTVLDIAPYRGVLGVLISGGGAPEPVTLTDDRCTLPKGLMSHFKSFDGDEAAKALLDHLVAIYREILDFNGTIVVRLFEAADGTPMVADFDGREIYLERGALRGAGY
jgi:hypothetical protein